MKIILAPDKYKGSLTGQEFCDVVAPLLQKEGFEVIKLPLADGGDGTIEVINFYLSGEMIKTRVSDPLFRFVEATYFFSKASKVAFIEMAEASGITLLKPADQNCMNTSTYGTGELIQYAIDNGAEQIILGIGGSATNDCGIGMASALGYKFLDKNDKELNPIGKELIHIVKIDDANIDERLAAVKFQVACDVTNPLYGPSGSAYVYAKQKGASGEDILYLDKGLKHFASVLNQHFNTNVQQIKGAGAAGGMGAGTVTFLNAELLPGIELIKQIANFDKNIIDADWIITGEGQLDEQTRSGKALSGLLKSAKTHEISVAAFCGNITLDETELKHMGISYSASIQQKASSFEDAIQHTKTYLKEITEDFVKSIQ